MAYQWVTADTYGGLTPAGEQAGQNAATNWFRQAQMVQGLDQQARAEADAEQQAQQKQAETAAQWAWTRNKDAMDRAFANRVQTGVEAKNAKETTADKSLAERDSVMAMKNLMPLADDGTLSEDHMIGLLPEHKKILLARRDTARQAAEAEHNVLSKAFSNVDLETMLNQYVDQSKAASGWFHRANPRLPAWQDQLAQATGQITPDQRVAVKTLPVDPESGFHAAPPPLPWMRRPMAAPVVAAPARATALPPHVQQTLQSARAALQSNPAAKAAILKRLADNGIDPNLL